MLYFCMALLCLFYFLWLCYASVMLLICWCYCFIMLILYLHYKDKGYNSNDIPLTQVVLKRKSELNEEDEISEDEQEEDEEYIRETDDVGMCIIVWFVSYSYGYFASVKYNKYCLSVMKPELVWLQLGRISKLLYFWYTYAMLLLWLYYAAVMIISCFWYDYVILMLLSYYAYVILP